MQALVLGADPATLQPGVAQPRDLADGAEPERVGAHLRQPGVPDLLRDDRETVAIVPLTSTTRLARGHTHIRPWDEKPIGLTSIWPNSSSVEALMVLAFGN